MGCYHPRGAQRTCQHGGYSCLRGKCTIFTSCKYILTSKIGSASKWRSYQILRAKFQTIFFLFLLFFYYYSYWLYLFIWPGLLIFSFFLSLPGILMASLFPLLFVPQYDYDASMFFYSTKFVSQDTSVFLGAYKNLFFFFYKLFPFRALMLL